MANNDIHSIAKRAGLKITTTSNYISVKHQLNWGSKSTIGILFFLFGGIAVSTIPFIKEASTTSTVFGVVLGFVLVLGSVLTLIRDTVDGLKVEGNSITFRYNLRADSIPLSPELEIKMRTDAMRVSGSETSGSNHIIITLYFQTADKEITVLRFSMDKAQADDALKLGDTIKRTINNHIFEATRSSL